MNSHLIAAIQYAHANSRRFLEDLKTFTRIPSVSTNPEAKPAMQQAAQWIADHLINLGIQQVQIMATRGHPVVYGELLVDRAEAVTVLVYGHYDVQPAEPLELWESGAFDPTVRGEHIFARGVTDMKGQVLAGIHAIESIVRTAAPAQYPAPSAPMPVNVKFLIEGEEEIGSPSLSDFMRTNRELLSCDMALNLDTGILSASQPSITYALRGLAYFELRVYGPAHDLHSGIYGGVVHNPAQALCELIAGMHDAQGHVTLPGFYEKVRVVGDEEKAELAYLSADTAPSPMNELYFLEETGVPALWGEAEYTPLERVSARPTLEVHGLFSGFTGEGSKTALPAWAMAKISCRLVPDQDPQEVYKQFLNYLKKHAPPTIRWEVTKMAGGPAVISERNSIGVKAMQKALASVWGTPPLFKREGGSVPVVTQFRNILGVESVNSGFAMTGDNAHGPNEKLHLPTWYRGIDAVIHFFFNLSNQSNNEAS